VQYDFFSNLVRAQHRHFWC